MSAAFHPDAAMLLTYAAGSLDEATSLMMATHATFCPECRAQVAAAETVGGLVLDDLPPDRMAEGALGALMRQIEEEPDQPATPRAAHPVGLGLPAPLAPYVKTRSDGIAWNWLAPGVKQILLFEGPDVRVRMLQIAAGKPMPHHRHAAFEFTLVLKGAYHDESGQFGVGDFITADVGVSHQPVAADQGCTCLIMSGAPMQLTSRLGRLINPFMPF